MLIVRQPNGSEMAKKAVILVSVGLAALYLLNKARRRASRRPAPHTPHPQQGEQVISDGDLAIRIVPVRGRLRRIAGQLLIGANAQLIEGAGYRLDVAVTNRSTRAALPVSIDVLLNLKATAGPTTLLDDSMPISLKAAEVRQLSSRSFAIPAPLATSLSGTIVGKITSRDGLQLASMSAIVDVVQAAVVPTVDLMLTSPGGAPSPTSPTGPTVGGFTVLGSTPEVALQALRDGIDLQHIYAMPPGFASSQLYAIRFSTPQSAWANGKGGLVTVPPAVLDTTFAAFTYLFQLP